MGSWLTVNVGNHCDIEKLWVQLLGLFILEKPLYANHHLFFLDLSSFLVVYECFCISDLIYLHFAVLLGAEH